MLLLLAWSVCSWQEVLNLNNIGAWKLVFEEVPKVIHVETDLS